jgi:hypothetical protein
MLVAFLIVQLEKEPDLDPDLARLADAWPSTDPVTSHSAGMKYSRSC